MPTWFGVTNGSISLAATGSSGSPLNTKIVSIPLTTGSVPLVAGLWALVWLSWEAKSQTTATKFSIAQHRFFAAVKGAASVGSYWLSAPFSGPSIQMLPPVASHGGFCLDGDNPIDQYVQITPHLNSSGDLEVYLNCLASQSDTWDFDKLSIEYQIVGCI